MILTEDRLLAARSGRSQPIWSYSLTGLRVRGLGALPTAIEFWGGPLEDSLAAVDADDDEAASFRPVGVLDGPTGSVGRRGNACSQHGWLLG
jgi:hypothetical protein